MSENIIRDDNGDLQKLTISNSTDDKCKFCGSFSCGGYNCLNGLRNQLADAETEIERLRSVMSHCVRLMKGSNCTEEELLSEALKKGLNL